jgi:hypothetical protein
MSDPTLAVVANEVEHLKGDVKDLKATVDAILQMQRWQMGGAVGAGAVLTLLLPKISAALGLT